MTGRVLLARRELFPGAGGSSGPGATMSIEERLARLTLSVESLSAQVQALQMTNNQTITHIDTAWRLETSMVIFLMQIGFAMLEVGFVRAKSTKSILMKNLLDCCVTAIVWYLVGAPLAVRSRPTFTSLANAHMCLILHPVLPHRDCTVSASLSMAMATVSSAALLAHSILLGSWRATASTATHRWSGFSLLSTRALRLPSCPVLSRSAPHQLVTCCTRPSLRVSSTLSLCTGYGPERGGSTETTQTPTLVVSWTLRAAEWYTFSGDPLRWWPPSSLDHARGASMRSVYRSRCRESVVRPVP